MRFNATAFIGNAAMLVALVLVGALLIDWIWAWFGYDPFAFCGALLPMIYVTQAFAIAVTTVGIVVWVVSMFKSPSGFALTVGGLLVGTLPMILPHYLGATCAL